MPCPNSVLVTLLSGDLAKLSGAITKLDGPRADLALPVRLEVDTAVSIEDSRQTFYGEVYDVVSLEQGVCLHRIYLKHRISGMDRIAHLTEDDLGSGSDLVSRSDKSLVLGETYDAVRKNPQEELCLFTSKT